MSHIISQTNVSIDKFIECKPINGSSVANSRRTHLEYALSQSKLNGNVLEFGVFEGTTINIISNFFKNSVVYGFDSFEGLPEDWITNDKQIKWPKGHFKVNSLPKVNNNVILVKGWFDNSLPQWLKSNEGPISFLHVDCDLFSSTETILTQLNSCIVKDTIIVFDELYHWTKPKKYKHWQEGEYKALVNWLCKFNRKFKIISRNNYMQAAIKIL